MDGEELDMIALDYGRSNNLPCVSLAEETDSGRYYHLTSPDITGKKTGPPRFIFVTNHGTVREIISSNERYSLLASVVKKLKAAGQ